MTGRPLGAISKVAFVAALACSSRQPEPMASADSLIAPGESLYTHGAYDRATTAWTEALGRAGVAGSPTQARLLTWLGLAAYRQGDYTEARRLGERALALKRELGMPPTEVAESQNALGLLAWNEGRLRDAVALLRDALAAFGAAKDRWGVAKSSNNLALVTLEFGRFNEARQGFETARTAAREIGNQRVESRATTNLAMIEIWTGDPRAAQDLLAEARRLADAADDPVGQESALGQLAVAWSVLGELGRALAVLDSALDIARRHGLRQEEANDLVVAASIYDAAGDADRAIQLYDRARAINDELGLGIETGTVLRHQAMLRASRGTPEQARAELGRALSLHRKAGARIEELHDLLALNQLETEAGNQAAAARWLTRAHAVAAELDAPQTRVALAVAQARTADRRSDPGTTLSALRSIAGDLEFSGIGAVIESEWLRARAFAALGQLDSAVRAGRRSVAGIEQAGRSFGSPVLRAGVTTERGEVFADLVIALLRLGQTEEAFLVADAARGRALLDHLASARDAARRDPMGRDLVERQRLLRAIDALQSRLEEVQTRPRQERGPDGEATSRELAERLRQARAEYEGVLIRLAEREPARARLIGARLATHAEIRAALQPNELLVQYLVTGDRVVIFAATQASLRTYQVPLPAVELENRVRLARGLMSSPTREAASRAVLEELHRILIRPLAESLARPAGIQRLVIVPHGVLTYLPFAVLRNPKSGRHLIEEYSVQYLPTAAALPALRGAVGSARSAELGETTVFAPLPEQLPATAAEATAIERIIPRTHLVMGNSGTEAALRKVLAEGQAVHVATHGTMNPQNPMFSSLRLARGSGSYEDDGRLEVHELLGMAVASPIVFLSGCETALGGARQTTFDRGQDYATLAQAFLYAGAKGVVATLWRIDDQGAAAFAQRFYWHLATQPAAAALAAAQRDLMGDPQWGHPYYWAAYTLAGAALTALPANPAEASVSP